MSWLNSKWISHPWIYIYKYIYIDLPSGNTFLAIQTSGTLVAQEVLAVRLWTARRRCFWRRSTNGFHEDGTWTGSLCTAPEDILQVSLQNGNSIWKATLKNWRPVSCWSQIISAHVWHYLSTYSQTSPKSGGRCHPLPKMTPMSFIQVRGAENKLNGNLIQKTMNYVDCLESRFRGFSSHGRSPNHHGFQY
jgi:hypothetical protein